MPLYTARAVHPGYKATRTYHLYDGTASSAVSAVDIIYFVPFMLPRPISFSAGTIRVITGGAGSSVKAGIWANSPVSDYPLGAPLYVDNTGVATTGNNTSPAIALGTGSLAANTLYWWGAKFTGTLPSILSTGSNVSTYCRLRGGVTANQTASGFADAYANDMPTMAEGASFTTVVTSVGVGMLVAA